MPTTSASTVSHVTARCTELAAVFQDQLLEEPLPASAPGAVRRRQVALITTAPARTATPKPTVAEVLAAAATVTSEPRVRRQQAA